MAFDLDEERIRYLEMMRSDLRDEVKQRITQRDNYAVQMVVALGVILVGVLSFNGNTIFLLFAPLVTLYYTFLILASYRVHRKIGDFFRGHLNPEINRICDIPPELDWETFYRSTAKKIGGMRIVFFSRVVMWVVNLISISYLLFVEITKEKLDVPKMIFIGIIIIVYLVLMIIVSKEFSKLRK